MQRTIGDWPVLSRPQKVRYFARLPPQLIKSLADSTKTEMALNKMILNCAYLILEGKKSGFRPFAYVHIFKTVHLTQLSPKQVVKLNYTLMTHETPGEPIALNVQFCGGSRGICQMIQKNMRELGRLV